MIDPTASNEEILSRGGTIHPLNINIVTHGGDYRMAEAVIRVGTHVIGYVGGSGHEATVLEAAEEAVAKILAPLLAAHPEVTAKSRFDYDDEYDTGR